MKNMNQLVKGLNYKSVCFALCLGTLVTACKVEVIVPEGGRVTTESGTYSCGESETCVVTVKSIYFNQAFKAEPFPGYRFLEWEKVEKGFCGGSAQPCNLSTRTFPDYPALMELLYSDQAFYLQPVFVKPEGWLRTMRSGDEQQFKANISQSSLDISDPSNNPQDKLDWIVTIRYQGTTGTSVPYPVLRQRMYFQDGTESEQMVFQDASGALHEYTDESGTQYMYQTNDSELLSPGLPLIPSPLMSSFTGQYRYLKQVRDGHLPLKTIQEGVRSSSIKKQQELTVPMGVFTALEVSVIDTYRGVLLSTLEHRRERIFWVVPQIGIIKFKQIDETWNYLGNLSEQKTIEAELESVNYEYQVTK